MARFSAFENPAQDFITSRIDLNDLLAPNQNSVYYFKAAGECMAEGGINDGDLLVVDSSLKAEQGSIVIAAVEDEFLVRQLQLKPVVQLNALSSNCKPTIIGSEDVLDIFGVVTYILKATK
ncbi:UmuD [Enterobacter hormaechei]|uniref:S24 family peptidase n=1 Tax=Enterobacteriaceae TaxID=543 RepID=UPI0012518FC5|nr:MULTISPECIES: S24 family peptidase [Enterobacteriaceae]MCE9984068.1 DNA polymerase V subunit UmuD [Leclercia adecarboxylata]VAE21249.1 UmuD [Enterobacter hormaechei]VAE26816.1 UmuD [Enterobacter hormaechei]